MPAFLQNKHTISLYFIIKGGLRQYTYIIFLKANKTGKGKNTCRFLGVSNLPHCSSDFPIKSLSNDF